MRWLQTRAVSQLLWPVKDREEWFSWEENHEKGLRFGLHQLRNCSSRVLERALIAPELAERLGGVSA
jgi:hypothetical protein